MLISKSAVETPEIYSSKPFDLAVVIGRFQLPHVGHSILFNKAASIANNVLVLVGSSYQPRTIKNPFTFKERADLIQTHFFENKSTEEVIGIDIEPIKDNLYSDTSWVNQVQNKIETSLRRLKPQKSWVDNPPNIKDLKICIVGNKKDETSYYLDLFPQYTYVPVDEFKLRLSSTDLRTILFTNIKVFEIADQIVSKYVLEFLNKFIMTPEYKYLLEEYKFIKKYKESWSLAPYDPTFVTVDSLVLKAGHILMIQRKDSPGKGLWALPGGFLNPKERIFDAAVRELQEETSIDLPPAVIKGSFVRNEIFDHPDRSLRGRTITHNHLFVLDGHDRKSGLPKVKAADDASNAKWFPISEVVKMDELIFEDHLSMIKSLLALE